MTNITLNLTTLLISTDVPLQIGVPFLEVLELVPVALQYLNNDIISVLRPPKTMATRLRQALQVFARTDERLVPRSEIRVASCTLRLAEELLRGHVRKL